ncbi:venom serine protease inhibitor-like [Athalia rosae]|uniref:venom serine protease inhibitor-like n=1 Tax=Athalia rosae TaxID=37344 RepID=UPI00203327B0|nr:venom serine protease inhibitor-like [Athalia rosae]
MEREFLAIFTLLISGAAAHYSLNYCGPNTMVTPCGNLCEPYCGQLKPVKYCSPICQKNGCVCKPGYKRRDPNGPCIPEFWCETAAETWDWVEEPYHPPPLPPARSS